MDLDCVSQHKNCVKGIPCGNTCISKGKNCKPKPNAQINAVANLLANPDNLEKGAEKSKEVSQNNNVKIKQEDLEKNKSALTDKFGKELVDKAESNTQKIINENDVMVRVPSQHIDSILAEGKMLNSGEITDRTYPKDSRDEDDPDTFDALDYQNTRNQSEEAVLGLSKDTPSSERPIYGYIGNSSDMTASHQKSVSHYGDVAFKLKPEVKDRVSVSTEDSWSGNPASKSGEFNAGSFTNGVAKDGSIPDYKAQSIEKSLNGAAESKSIDEYVQKTGSPYLESQIQGGVKTSDIAEMFFTNGAKPSANTIKWADKNGVKIFTYD